FWPLLKNEWAEMGEPTPPRRRTHGGTGAGSLALVKPLPPQAVAARPGFTRAKRLRPQSPPADRWAVAQDDAFALRRRAGDAPPTRNSKEPDFAVDVIAIAGGGGSGKLRGCAPWHRADPDRFGILVEAAT